MTKQKNKIKKGAEFYIIATLFLLPSLFALIVFKYFTSVQAFVYSFFDYDFYQPPGEFLGFANYVSTLKSPTFWLQLKNTLILYGWGLILGFWVPIVQALFLNEMVKGKSVFRYLYVLPSAIPSIASMTIWMYIWNTDYGLANSVTSFLGLGEFGWLEDANLVKFTLRFSSIIGGGLGMMIYVVSIESIDNSIFEAAKIDGANAFRTMIHITLPNMHNIINMNFLLSLTGCLLAFDDILVMTNGGPGDASSTIVFGIYQKAFGDLNYGQAMATSIILLLFSLVFVAVKLVSQRREESNV